MNAKSIQSKHRARTNEWNHEHFINSRLNKTRERGRDREISCLLSLKMKTEIISNRIKNKFNNCHCGICHSVSPISCSRTITHTSIIQFIDSPFLTWLIDKRAMNRLHIVLTIVIEFITQLRNFNWKIPFQAIIYWSIFISIINVIIFMFSSSERSSVCVNACSTCSKKRDRLRIASNSSDGLRIHITICYTSY